MEETPVEKSNSSTKAKNPPSAEKVEITLSKENGDEAK
ncbi:hypothetical protein PI125_g11564 [Phytophthora idaei]|nr:hypothetical protein PI125_g11564 [Phytophthora idaei]